MAILWRDVTRDRDADGELGEPINAGAFGHVYRATWAGTRVAFKMLPSEGATSARVAQWKREAALQSRLTSPHVLRVWGVAVDERDPLRPKCGIVLPLARTSLASVLSDAAASVAPEVALPLPWRVSALHELARGLAHIHGRRVVHGDLKPGNVLIVDSGTGPVLQIADFGCAREAATTGRTGALSTAMTGGGEAATAGLARGTLRWMAPELLSATLLRSSRPSYRSDVYAWGVLAWQVLTAAPLPWAGLNDEQVREAIRQGEHISLDALPRTLTAALRALLETCLSRSPTDRPRSGAELLEALQGASPWAAAAIPPLLSSTTPPHATGAAHITAASPAVGGSAAMPVHDGQGFAPMLRPWHEAIPPLRLTSCPICADDNALSVRLGCGDGDHAVCYPCALRHVREEMQPHVTMVRCPCCLADAHTSPVNIAVLLDVTAWSRSPSCCGSESALRPVSDELLARITALPVMVVEAPLPEGVFKRCPSCGEGIQHARGHACHHIRPGSGCPSCGTHFCYACLGPYPCTRGCAMFCTDACDCPDCIDCSEGAPCSDCDNDGRCRVCQPQVGPVVSAGAADRTRGLAAVSLGHRNAAALVAVLQGVDGCIADVASRACAALTDIASDNLNGQACIVAAAPAAIVAAMRAHGGNAELVQHGCWALAKIALIAFGGEACVDAGAPSVIVSAIRVHGGSFDVVHYGCWALAKIALIDSGPQACVDAGAPATIVAAMCTNNGSIDVARDGCLALANISTIDSGAQACVDAGAPAAIIAAMGSNGLSAYVAHYGCQALSYIADIASGSEACVDAGAPATIVAAMSAHGGSAEVANYSFRALANIACNDFGRELCVDADALTAIVAVMGAHVSSANIAGNGCWALSSIAVIDSCEQACVNAGAPAAIVAAMGANEVSADVAQYGCQALYIIARIDSGKQACVDAGAPVAIVAAMRVHGDSAEVALNGCFALVRIALIDSGKQACVGAGAPAAIVAAMRAHGGSAEMAQNSCGALSNIANIDSGKQACLDAGAPAAIVAAMRAHRDSAGVAEYGCRALYVIAFIDSGAQACVDAGAPAAIVAAMRAHGDSAEVAQYGSLALAGIAVFDFGIQACVVAGAPSAIVAALRAHGGSADVADMCCYALLNIAGIDSGRQACVDAGAPAALVAAKTLAARP